jgi:hypothetical protein
MVTTPDPQKKETKFERRQRLLGLVIYSTDEPDSDETEEEEKKLEAVVIPPKYHVLEEEMPDDLPHNVYEMEPVEDVWRCNVCKNSPCMFLQLQDEIIQRVALMGTECTNKTRRYHTYRYLTRRIHGVLRKLERRPLPDCFSQGMKELYPSPEYTGFKLAKK